MNIIKFNKTDNHIYTTAGLFSLALRLVVGWTYFSAFWRRLVLTNKLDPEVTGYIGEKFNHFLPNALGIKPLIESLVSHPDALWWAMLAFTIIEGIVGLLFMVGLFTRLMSVGVFSLAGGILLGSGWLGTTCLDEWQIGVLGISAGFTIFFTGSGYYSLDNLLYKRGYAFTARKWFVWLSSGALPINHNRLKIIVLVGSLAIMVVTLFTNQHFHGGVWGKLHNKSVKPKIEISNSGINDNALSFTVFRVEGADVYGSFLIGITLKSQEGDTIINLDNEELAKLPALAISNKYIAKVKPGKHSLIIPLGSKATVTLKNENLSDLPAGAYMLQLTDISGITWTDRVIVK